MINRRHLFTIGVATALWLCNGAVSTTAVNFIAAANAVVGAPGVGAAPANRGGPVNRVGVR